MQKEVLILYVPVIHAGYEKLFQRLAAMIDVAYIIDSDLISEFTGLHSEIRALDPERALRYVRASGYFKNVDLIDRQGLDLLKYKKIVLINDQLCRNLIRKYSLGLEYRFEDIFLRYDEKNVFSQQSVNYDRVSIDPYDQFVINWAKSEAIHSSDWWRQVGAVLVNNSIIGDIKQGDIVLAYHNKHVPSEHMPYIYGDPRDFIKAGQNSELSSALHGEQAIIVEAAKQGIGLGQGDYSIYVTVFPCPVCAKLIAYSGIKRCFFSHGHASLDGERTLKSQGVEIILVQ